VTFTEKSAVLSPCGAYRYELARVWDPARPGCVFVMLNPSTADADKDDPTIRKVCGFADRWGFGRVVVVNLFAFRTRYPWQMFDAADPIGPENDAYIIKHAKAAPLVVVAWGQNVVKSGRPVIRERPARLGRLLDGVRFQMIGPATKSGNPTHPVMLSYSRPLTDWPAGRA
jgi:hypothetical protein